MRGAQESWGADLAALAKMAAPLEAQGAPCFKFISIYIPTPPVSLSETLGSFQRHKSINVAALKLRTKVKHSEYGEIVWGGLLLIDVTRMM